MPDNGSPLLAVKRWLDGPAGLRGSKEEPGPLTLGATINEFETNRSPASGAFVVLTRSPEGVRSPVAEDDAPVIARIVHLVVSPKPATADAAAMALATAIRSAAPPACPMGAMVCLATANVQGPISVPGPGVDEWDYCQQVTADYLLYDQGD